MLGLTSFLAGHPEVGPAADLLARLAARLCRQYRQEATAGWRWFEPALTYDNALLPLALWRAHALTRDPESRDAFRGAYLVTRDHRYLRRMREAFAWFLGANRLGAAVYDSATAGCRDGLGENAPNLNQGAESTVSFLLSLIEMLELAGEGLEYAHGAEAGA